MQSYKATDTKTYQIKVQLYKLAIARSDIGTAKTLCVLCLKQNKKIERKKPEYDWRDLELMDALLDAMINSYCRPFTDNHPFGSLQKKWCKFDNQLHKAIHLQLMEFRNQKVAHTDHQTRQVFVYNGYYDKSLSGALLITNRKFPTEHLPLVQEMCEILFHRFKKQIDVLTRYLLSVLPECTTDIIELFSEKPLGEIKNGSRPPCPLPPPPPLPSHS